eukprot:g72737.t1
MQVKRAKHNEYLRKHTVAPTSRLLLAQTAQKKCAELQNIASYKHIPASRNFTFLTFPLPCSTRPSQNPGTVLVKIDTTTTHKLSLKSENPRIMLGLSVYIGRCQSRVLQGRRALTCTGRTFHLPPAQLGREDGGRAGPGMWHLRALAGTRGRLGGDEAALRTVAGQRAAESVNQRFQSSPGWPLSVKIRRFGLGPDPKAEPVVAAPQPEQEVQLQQAEAKRDRSKAELKEAQAKLKEAEAKLKEAEAKLKEAEAKLEKAEAKLEKAEAKLEKAEANLNGGQGNRDRRGCGTGEA